MAQRLKSVEVGNHIIAVYPDRASMFDDAFEFMRPALDRNEVMMLLTDSMTKDEMRGRMRKEWNVDVSALEESGDIIIRSVSEWHLLGGKLDTNRTIALWKALAEQTMARGKSGIRVFGDTTEFFTRGQVKELLAYETTLEERFNFPMMAICAYEEKNVQNYTKEEFDELCKHHNPAWLPKD